MGWGFGSSKKKKEGMEITPQERIVKARQKKEKALRKKREKKREKALRKKREEAFRKKISAFGTTEDHKNYLKKAKQLIPQIIKIIDSKGEIEILSRVINTEDNKESKNTYNKLYIPSLEKLWKDYIGVKYENIIKLFRLMAYWCKPFFREEQCEEYANILNTNSITYMEFEIKKIAYVGYTQGKKIIEIMKYKKGKEIMKVICVYCVYVFELIESDLFVFDPIKSKGLLIKYIYAQINNVLCDKTKYKDLIDEILKNSETENNIKYIFKKSVVKKSDSESESDSDSDSDSESESESDSDSDKGISSSNIVLKFDNKNTAAKKAGSPPPPPPRPPPGPPRPPPGPPPPEKTNKIKKKQGKRHPRPISNPTKSSQNRARVNNYINEQPRRNGNGDKSEWSNIRLRF